MFTDHTHAHTNTRTQHERNEIAQKVERKPDVRASVIVRPYASLNFIFCGNSVLYISMASRVASEVDLVLT